MNDRDKVIALAEQQVGVSEEPPGSNSVIYNRIYYGSDNRQPWCVAFLWWLFYQLGISEEFCGGEKTAYCPYVVNWARRHNSWVTDGYQPGDLVFFDWDSDGKADHIGIVVSVLGSALTTIEGNCSDKVSRMTRNAVAVLGAYRPRYGAETPTQPVATPSAGSSDIPGNYTVQKGDTLWGIAERFLGAGERYVQIMSANNLVDSLIHPGQVLVIPNGNTVYRTIQVTITNDTYELLTIMADGWNKTIGQCIDALMEDAV